MCRIKFENNQPMVILPEFSAHDYYIITTLLKEWSEKSGNIKIFPKKEWIILMSQS
jgi:hypothetical protein